MKAPTKRELNAKMIMYRQLSADRLKEVEVANELIAELKKGLNMFKRLAADRLKSANRLIQEKKELGDDKFVMESILSEKECEIIRLKKEAVILQAEVFMLTKENNPMELPSHEEETFSPLKASRFNKGKPELSYILDAPIAMKGLAEVFAMGAEKYDRDNWKKGLDKNEIIDSLIRHLMAFKSGELVDSESGKCHTHHVHWNALVLAEQFCSGYNRTK